MPSERWRDRVLLPNTSNSLDPRAIHGLFGWFQAKDLKNGGGLPANGTAASPWKDKSGLGHDLVVAGAGNPVFVTSGIAGLPSVSFNGANQWLMSTTFTTVAQPNDYFIVFKASTGGRLLDGSMASGRNLIDSGISPAAAGMFAGSGLNSSGPINTSVHVLEGLFNTTSSLMVLDGTTIASGNTGVLGQSRFSVGADDAGNQSGQYGGLISEILAYNALLSTANRALVMAYLRALYGTP